MTMAWESLIKQPPEVFFFKKVFLKVSQISKEKTIVWVSEDISSGRKFFQKET